MADTGWLNPSATGAIYNEWTNPSYAYSSDNQYASNSGDADRDEQDFYNFNISIPSGATINGIELSIEAKNYSLKKPNFRTKLSWDSGSSWSATKDTGAYSSETYKSVGGSTDTWGRTWSVSEFSNSNFRVYLQNIGDSAGTSYPCCDHVCIKIYYTESAGISAQGTIDAVSAISGASNVSFSALTTINANSDIAGITNISLEISGLITASSDVAGIANVLRNISAVIDAISDVAGIAKIIRYIAGLITAESNIAGIATVVSPGAISVSGIIEANSNIVATLTVISAQKHSFIEIYYISNGSLELIEFSDDMVDSIEIIPQVADDIQRLQNNFPVVYKKADVKKINLNLYPQTINEVEILKNINEIIYLYIYKNNVLLNSYVVKLDRQSCKTYGYFGGVPMDKNMQLIFYETENGYACLESPFTGIVY